MHLPRPINGGAWQADTVALRPDGTTIAMAADAAPNLVRAYTDFSPINSLYGAFADEFGSLHLYHMNLATSRWQDTGVVDTSTERIYGRPAMMWQNEPSYDAVGTLQIWYVTFPGLQAKHMRSYRTWVTDTGGNRVKKQFLGLTSFVTNQWLFLYAADFLWDSNLDSNMRALVVNATGADDSKVQFWPIADGRPAGDYNNRNDWATMTTYMCPLTATANDTVTNPVLCH